MSATGQATEPQKNTRDQGRVLLVTDELTRPAHVSALEGGGFAVVGVAGGAAAIVALHRSRPHVVVADLSVRGITTVELARTLAQSSGHVPLVLVGAEDASRARRQSALDSGAFDYFQLPTETGLLVARTAQLVEMKLTIDRLRAEADRDYLTGLANRRRFRTALGQELERWRRYRTPCALLMVDIDHLKRINDAHGHSAGDTVIRHVAATLTRHSRDNDTAARLGGEEFALLLAGASEESALIAADRLRQAVSSFVNEAGGVATVSVGVAACPAHATNERALYAVADAAMYQAKHEGRDRSVIAPRLQTS